MARKKLTPTQKVVKLEKEIKRLKSQTSKQQTTQAKWDRKIQKIQNKRNWLDKKAQHKYQKRAQKIEHLNVLGDKKGRTTRATIKAGVAAQGISETGSTVRSFSDANSQANELIKAGSTNVNQPEKDESNPTYEDIYGGLG